MRLSEVVVLVELVEDMVFVEDVLPDGARLNAAAKSRRLTSKQHLRRMKRTNGLNMLVIASVLFFQKSDG